MERIIFKPKIRKMFDFKGICYLKLNGSIYFLEETKNKSFELLRAAMSGFNKRTNKEKPIFKPFIKEIEQNYKNYLETIKKTKEKKKKYYAQRRILIIKKNIHNLKKKIKQEKRYLMSLNNENKDI
jgi:hypothetical protein